MKIILIRHGKTQGNIDGRYLGKTNEGLSEIGISEIKENIKNKIYPSAMKVITSPMKRCIETAMLIYNNKGFSIMDSFREINFGLAEGLTHDEVIKIPGLENFGEKWSEIVFPEGEGIKDFKKRCFEGFLKIRHLESVAVITHGGVIMSIMHQIFGKDESDYFDFFVENGKGFVITESAFYKYEKI